MIELKSFKRRFFFDSIVFFSFHVQNGFFFLSLGCFILQLMLIFSLFSFFVFSFNICLIHKEKHAFFHFFHSVFCIFSGLLFIFFLLVLGYQGWRKGQIFFCITWVLMAGFFCSIIFLFYIDFFFLFFTCLLFCDLKWIE